MSLHSSLPEPLLADILGHCLPLHRVVRARVTGFWTRPLAGVFGLNVSTELPDMSTLLLHTIIPGQIGLQHEPFVTGPLSGR